MTTERQLQALHALAAGAKTPLGVPSMASLALTLGVTKHRAWDIVRSLERHGLVENQRGRYCPTERGRKELREHD